MTDTPASLAAPLYGATMGQAISRFFKKYATFSGRASRSEYWWVTLFFAIIGAIIGIPLGILARPDTTTGSLGAGFVVLVVLASLFFLALIVPSIAVGVRRLHDANFSGLLYLLHLVPYIGGLIVLILNILPSKPEGARFDA